MEKVDLEVLRKSEELVKKYKTLFEAILEEFKNDFNVEGMELVIDNNDEMSAIYLDITLTMEKLMGVNKSGNIEGNISSKETIERIQNHLKGINDRVILNLFVEYSVEEDSDVLGYELVNAEGIETDTNIKYLNLSHDYIEDYRYFSYDLKEDDKILHNRLDKLFEHYEYDVFLDINYE